jgi:hypothetical protein
VDLLQVRNYCLRDHKKNLQWNGIAYEINILLTFLSKIPPKYSNPLKNFGKAYRMCSNSVMGSLMKFSIRKINGNGITDRKLAIKAYF